MRILYFEDDKTDQSLFKTEATKRGYKNVKIDDRGSEVFNKIKEYNPDILIMDWVLENEKMPFKGVSFDVTDGDTIAVLASSLWPEMPVVVLTSAYEEDLEKDDTMLFKHIHKPINKKEWDNLFETIKKMFASAQAPGSTVVP